MPIQVKLLDKRATLPTRTNHHDSGLDLVILEDVDLLALVPQRLWHGIAVAIPLGFEAQIRPRSSALIKLGIHVATGTIDNGFRGELATAVVAMANVSLKAGQSVSQLVVAPVALMEPEWTVSLDTTDRDSDGWGSSDHGL